MAATDHLIELAWKTYNIAVVTAEIFGWSALIIGGIGYALSGKKTDRSMYYFGLLYGGTAALITVLFITGVYESVTYFMTGDVGGTDYTNMYPDTFLDFFDFSNPNDIFNITGAVSQIAAIIGMGGFTFGMSLWGITKVQSTFDTQSRKIMGASLFLMIASISERLLVAAAHVIFTISGG